MSALASARGLVLTLALGALGCGGPAPGADAGADAGATDAGGADAEDGPAFPACRPETCPDGCCDDDVCQTQPTPLIAAAHCGRGGIACVTCGAAANLCFEGTCACGLPGVPPCQAGSRCAGEGFPPEEWWCQCDATSCPNGCCLDGVCGQPGDVYSCGICHVDELDNCGTGGGQCLACSPETADHCVGGACACGGAAECPADEWCVRDGGEATCACPAAWDDETVDPAGEFVALRADAQGGLHLGYHYGDATGGLRYAYRPAAGAWSITTVDPGPDVGYYTSIDVDGAGGVHISYTDGADGGLKYASKPALGSWATATIDNLGMLITRTSLRVDADGGVHLAYHNATGLTHAYHPAAGAWTMTTVDSQAVADPGPVLDADPQGGIHIGYARSDGLWYAQQPAGGTWSSSPVNTSGEDLSLRVDGEGGVHLIYVDGDGLHYDYRPAGGEWADSLVSADVWGAPTSLAVDAQGGVHLAHLRRYLPPAGMGDSLTYSFKLASGAWNTAQLPVGYDYWTPATNGPYEIDLDPQRGIHIAYHHGYSAQHLYHPACP